WRLDREGAARFAPRTGPGTQLAGCRTRTGFTGRTRSFAETLGSRLKKKDPHRGSFQNKRFQLSLDQAEAKWQLQEPVLIAWVPLKKLLTLSPTDSCSARAGTLYIKSQKMPYICAQ